MDEDDQIRKPYPGILTVHLDKKSIQKKMSTLRPPMTFLPGLRPPSPLTAKPVSANV